jgi:hypothetical protein
MIYRIIVECIDRHKVATTQHAVNGTDMTEYDIERTVIEHSIRLLREVRAMMRHKDDTYT